MKVSIIVPVYNCEKYLDECVSSLINQTQAPHEIILVDDGSTDSSAKLCNKYADSNSIVKVFHKQNEGLGLTRNFGMDKASGDYVLFVDADDFLDLDFLEVTQSAIDVNECDSCKTCFKRVDQDYNVSYVNRIYSEEVFNNHEIITDLLPRLLGSKPGFHDALPMSACCTLYSRKIIVDNNLRFESEREWISEDIIFNISYFSKSERSVIIPYIGYNYRINTQSLTRSYREDRFIKSKALVIKEAEMMSDLCEEDIFKARLYQQLLLYTYMSINQLSVSDLDRNTILSKIKQICSDEYLIEAIINFPQKYISFKHKVFLFLLKHKHILLLKWMLVDRNLSN